jgi:hypothetical protein
MACAFDTIAHEEPAGSRFNHGEFSMRTVRVLATSCLAAMALATAAIAQPARRALTLDDLAKVRTVGDPQRSPDGKWVAYTVGTTDAEKDKRDSDIWMVSWDGKDQVRLTFSPDSESSPRWAGRPVPRVPHFARHG